MKFNFDKYTKSEEPVLKQQEGTELTQEQFDEQILLEAQKLGTNLQQLKLEIDQHGGVEKFKEYFEKQGENKDQNKAGAKLQGLSSSEYRDKSESKSYRNAAYLAFFASTLIELAQIYQNDSSISDEIDGLKELFAKGDFSSTVTALAGIVALIGGGFLYASAKKKIDARRVNKEKQKEELKFKMTGTEVKK